MATKLPLITLKGQYVNNPQCNWGYMGYLPYPALKELNMKYMGNSFISLFIQLL